MNMNNNIKPGPLAELPPATAKEWKAEGGRGAPPVAYEKVVRSADNTALEYEIYHAFVSQVTPREIERRIEQLRADRVPGNQRYNKAATYYLKKKLEEMVIEA